MKKKQHKKLTFRQKVKNYISFKYPDYELAHILYNDSTVELFTTKTNPPLIYVLFAEIDKFYEKEK